MKVLLIDDDIELGQVLTPALRKHEIVLVQAETPHKGLQMLADGGADVMLLDMILPGTDGMAVCEHIRQSTGALRNLPIIGLSARADLTDRIVGLERGLDDYIAKPFDIRELIARVRAMTRRPGRSQAAKAPTGVVLDELCMVARLGEFSINLTGMEAQILKALEEARGHVLSRLQILERLRRPEHADPALIDTVIYRLRRKFRRSGFTGDFIVTERGRGYRLVGDSA